MVKILKEDEAVGNVREVARKYNVSEKSFYRWRQKYVGMETAELRPAYLFELHGAPACITSDNGPEIVANCVQEWFNARHGKVRYYRPWQPLAKRVQ